MIVVAAFQARSVTTSALRTETFDNPKLNWTALVEVVLAVLITQLELMRRIFDTAQIGMIEWALSLAPAIALFFVWEIGKLIARQRSGPAGAVTAD
jgi:Ca2+-transporting ATPase